MADVDHEAGLLDAITDDSETDVSTPAGVEAETEAAYSPETSEPAAEVETTASDDTEAVADKATEPKDGTDKEVPPEKFVPHAALHEEREARKALETRYARLEERTNIMLQQMPKPAPVEQPEVEAAPNPEDDIFGAFTHLQAKYDALEQRVDGRAERQDAQAAAADQDAQLINTYRADCTQFAGDHPDFMEAYNFLRTSRVDELKAMGYDPASIDPHLMTEEKHIIQNALRDGIRPAEQVYKIAQMRGFAPKTNGAADPAAAATAEIDKIAAAQAANRSLGGGGGSEIKPMTAEDLNNLPEDEFWAYMEKNGGEIPPELMH